MTGSVDDATGSPEPASAPPTTGVPATASAPVDEHAPPFEQRSESPQAPDPSEPSEPPAPRAPSPLATLPTTPGAALRVAFDLLTRCSADVRRGSFYVGAVALATIGPVAVLVWGLEVATHGQAFEPDGSPLNARIGGWLSIAAIVASAGLLVTLIESRAAAAALLGARLDGRAFGIRDAVRRSRTTFWAVFRGVLLVSVPVSIAQTLLSDWIDSYVGGPSEFTAVGAAVLLAILAAPFAYVLTGVVLGDVGAVEATRRSVTVYRARRAGAVVVSLFALAAQLLTVFGASAGADLVLRVFDGLHIDPGSSDLAVAFVTVVILAAVFAYGSLTFTVAAISAAPQVVMFLGLTHTTMGLDRSQRAADAPPGWAAARPEFRWFTWPMRIGIVLAVLAAIGGLLSLNA